MSNSRETSFLRSIYDGMRIGFSLVFLYLGYRFIRPYWFAFRLNTWLTTEQDHIKEFSRTLHPLGYYEYRVHLSESGSEDIRITNKGRRVPVRLRAAHELDAGVLSSLIERTTGTPQSGDEQREFFEEVEWALNSAPGVYWYETQEGESCSYDEADRVVIEHRIYPDAVSQHEIINGVVEIASALKMIKRREANYQERLEGQQ